MDYPRHSEPKVLEQWKARREACKEKVQQSEASVARGLSAIGASLDKVRTSRLALQRPNRQIHEPEQQQ